MANVVSPMAGTERGDNTRTLVAFAVTIAALYFGAEILVPIALAILLSFVLAPTVRYLHKFGLGRVAPVGITVLLAFLIIAGLGAVIASQLRDLSVGLPRYEATIIRKIQSVKSMSSGGALHELEGAIAKFTAALTRSGQPAATTNEGVNAPGPNQSSTEAPPAQAPMLVQIVDNAQGPIATMLAIAAPLLHPLATAFIVLIFVVFILLQREDLRNRAIRLFGAQDLQRTTAAIDDGAKRLSRYLLTQCLVNACSGLVVGVSLWAIGVPSPILLGILFACLRFIPYVGPLMGSLLPVLLAASVESGWSMVLWTGAVLLVVELVIGQVVEPFAYGHNTGLSPIAIIVAATFWTVLWGPVGLFLSTPLTVCLVVLGRHVEHLAFLDVLLGDRPPLSPSESLYQRMLANDPVEASDQAQKCLTEMSLGEYYDNVALPALLMAQDDAAQNRLDPARQARMRDTTLEFMEDLEHEPDEDGQQRHFWNRKTPEAQKTASALDAAIPQEPVPTALRAPGSVLCVGARSPLDDAAAAMLTEVLIYQGIGARAETAASLSKAAIENLNVTGVALVCLSALDGSSPAFLRFVLRRLKRRAPEARIVLGTWWRRNGVRDTDEEIDAMVKEAKAATFTDVVQFCMAQQPPQATAATSVAATVEVPREALSA